MSDTTQQLALPPAGTPGDAGGESPAFNMDAFADTLKSEPKQDYSSAWTDAQPDPPPTPPTQDAPKEAPPQDAPAAGEGSAKESARVFLMMYDSAVQRVCMVLADHADYPAKRFAMEDAERKEAEKQLAIGIEKNNWGGIPWWGILCMMLLASGFGNYMLVREARRTKRDEEEAKARKSEAAAKAARNSQGQPLSPDSITDKNGKTVTGPGAAQPGRSPVTPSSFTKERGTYVRVANAKDAMPPAASQGAPFGLCPVCNSNPLKGPKKRFCSKSCAGKAQSNEYKNRTQQ